MKETKRKGKEGKEMEEIKGGKGIEWGRMWGKKKKVYRQSYHLSTSRNDLFS